MTRWLRLYDDTINDPKILKLPEAMRWHWIAMLCIASKNEGVLPPLDDVAIQLRVTTGKATEIMAALNKAGLLDKTETGYAPHNWSRRQYKSDVSTERVKRFRNGQRNVSETVSETVCSVSVSDSASASASASSSEKEKEEKKVRTKSDDWPSDYGDQFWKAFPRKTEKLAAMKKLAVVRKSGVVTFEDLMAGVKRYADLGTEPQYTKHPTTWLNAGCWADETGASGGQRNSNPRKTGYDALMAVAARKAREIAGDGEVAVSTDEVEFSFGDRADGLPAGGIEERGDRTSERHDRREPGSGSVLEGEIISPDKTTSGLSDGWGRH